jgi:hypothetical protein
MRLQLFLENDMEQIHAEIIKFLKDNPKPKDEQIHALAKELGMEPSEFEEHVYMILGDKLKKEERISEMMSLPPSTVEKLDPKTIDMEMLRRGIIAEMDAVNLYEQMAANATDERIKKIMLDVAYEEKVHAGEFEALLELIDEDYEEAEEEGEEEVEDEIGKGEEEEK